MSHKAEATVTRWIDGDTVVAAVDVWPGIIAEGEHIRLLGVDTPEKGKPGFKEATARVNELAPAGAKITLVLSDRHSQTLGRKVGTVYVGTTNITNVLIAEHLTKLDYAPGGYWELKIKASQQEFKP